VSWLHTHRYWLARRTVQVGILALFWLGAQLGLGVLTGNLSGARVFRTIPLADPYAVLQIWATGQWVASTALLGAGIILLFYALFAGRAFCSWVCPVNLLGDFSHWAKRRWKIRGQFRVGRDTRYWIMALALPVSALTGVAAFEWLSPISMIHRELIFGMGLGLLVIPGIVLLDLFVVEHGWCGSLCPLGAFYSLATRKALVRIGFDAARCDHCGDCVQVCPEPQVIDFKQMSDRGFIDRGECSNCTRCLEVCPRDAYHHTLRLVGGPAPKNEEGEHHATQSAA
jgi:ferredoxin-type protein NapH